MASQPTNNFDFQNFYGSTLSSDITNSTLTIPLATVPTPSEGILIISPDSANPEVIYYTSKGASTVTCASDGRGWDSSSATAWTQGTTVIMAPTAYVLRMLKSGSLFDTTLTGWTTLGMTPTYSSDAGNRSYVLATASDKSGTLSPGMRLKFDRSTAAPTQCASLNGTTQFFNKTTPAGMTFTNNFVVSAWVKLTSYGAISEIASRYNGTSGWQFRIEANGQVGICGFNAGAANYALSTSYQSIPLNKWVHVAAQLDMTTTSTGGTNNYILIDGVEVPNVVSRSGTNPTALVQAGNLEIGSVNAGTSPFPGKIAEVAIYGAKVTEATIIASRNQILLGSETNIISAYTLSNSLTDLATNANNLTANGSATTTNADSPYAQGATAGVTEFGIITAVSASTITLQVAEGSAVPATGTMTNFYYSPHRSPYKFPSQQNKWQIIYLSKAVLTQTNPVSGTWYNLTTTTGVAGGCLLSIPIGEWNVTYQFPVYCLKSANASDVFSTLSTSSSTESDNNNSIRMYQNSTELLVTQPKTVKLSLAAQTTYYVNHKCNNAGGTTLNTDSSASSGPGNGMILAELAYL